MILLQIVTFFSFCSLILSQNFERRSVKELLAEGIVKTDDVLFSKKFFDDLKARVKEEGQLWEVQDYEESPFKDMTYGEFLFNEIEFDEEPEIVERRFLKQQEGKNQRRGLPLYNHTTSIKDIKNLPDEYIFYYPGKNGAYQHCYNATMNPVRNQKSCGNCYLFASIHSYDDRTCKYQSDKGFMAWHRGNPQSVMSCNSWTTDYGYTFTYDCGGGNAFGVYGSLERMGMMENECLDYEVNPTYACPGDTGKCEDSNTILNSDKLYVYRDSSQYSRYRLQNNAGYNTYVPNKNYTETKRALIDNGPLYTSMYKYNSPEFHAYKSGVYTGVKLDSSSSAHAIEILGYGFEQTDQGKIPVWYAKNSWGTRWGENGYFKIQRTEIDGQDDNGIQFASSSYGGIPIITEFGCFGIRSDRSYVCNGRGKCVGNDICQCEDKYLPGEDCSTLAGICNGIYEYKDNVCNGQGYCRKKELLNQTIFGNHTFSKVNDTGICFCNPRFTGEYCHQLSAISIQAILATVSVSILIIILFVIGLIILFICSFKS